MRRLGDLAALLIVVAYAYLAIGTTEQGVADPVWRSAQAQGTLVVATDAGFRPFVDLQDNRYVGYDVELVEEIARRLGLEVRWVNVGFDGLFESLSAGQAHLIAAGVPLAPEQGWRARFSQPYLDAGLQLLVPADSPVGAVADLAGRTVAVPLGSDADTQARRLQRSVPALRIDSTALSPTAALALLRQGRAAAAIVDGPAAIAALRAGDLRVAASLTYEPYVLAVPAAGYQLQAEVDRVLADLRAEGYLAHLNDRWLR